MARVERTGLGGFSVNVPTHHVLRASGTLTGEVEAQVFCPACGVPQEDPQARFCGACGTQLPLPPDPSVTPPPSVDSLSSEPAKAAWPFVLILGGLGAAAGGLLFLFSAQFHNSVTGQSVTVAQANSMCNSSFGVLGQSLSSHMAGVCSQASSDYTIALGLCILGAVGVIAGLVGLLRRI